MANDDIQEKRLRARLALEGEARHAKREQTEIEISKMRQEAMLAMEGAERKAAREAKIKAEQERVENEKKRLAEIERLRQLEAERKAAQADKERVEKERQAKIKETQIEKIHQAEARVETIKQAPGLSITSVRTLQTDLAQAVERRKLSSASIAVKNQEAGQNLGFETAPKSSPIKTILVFILIIILIGAGGGAIWYTQKIKTEQAVPIANLDIPKLIIAEHTEVINISSSTPTNKIKTEIKNKLAGAESGITNFYFTIQITNLENPKELDTIFTNPTKFIELAGIRMPDGILRSVGDTFTIGVLNDNSVKTSFIILQIKPDSTDRALAQMFDWEETITADLADLLLVYKTGTSTPNKSFTDKRINNLDVRILYHLDQSPALLYTFFNNKYIIIATDDKALGNIIARLAP